MAAALSQVRHGNSAAGGLELQNAAPALRPRSRPDLDGAQSFPPRYRGAFEREQHQAGAGGSGGRPALSSDARSMLSRRFGSAAAGDLISIVERMAAAAADDAAGTDLRR
jgi:hypothetical protein